MVLSVKRVARLKEPGRYLDAAGLYLQVKPSGAKSWLLRWERAGRDNWMGLGPLRDCTLDEARARSRLARQQLHNGTDPRAARKAERAARIIADAKSVTFAAAAQMYFDARAAQWRNAKHSAQFLSSLRSYAYPVIGSLPVAAVDMAVVLKVLEPQWLKKNETMRRVRARIEAVLDFAGVRGYRPASDNPARWSGWLAHALASPASVQAVRHHPALEYLQMPDFAAALSQREGVAP